MLVTLLHAQSALAAHVSIAAALGYHVECLSAAVQPAQEVSRTSVRSSLFCMTS